MQESLSNAEYDAPQQLEFDFEGYDSEPNSEDSFEKAETLTLQAISSAPAFTDFFEDAKCLTRLYDNTSDDERKGFFYLFRAHDAVTGRNIAVKTTNPAFCEEHQQLNDYLKWESAVLSRLKGKNRIQQICTPLKSIQVPVSCDGDIESARCLIESGDLNSARRLLDKSYKQASKTLQGYQQSIERLL
jgi:hypothetical protein